MFGARPCGRRPCLLSGRIRNIQVQSTFKKLNGSYFYPRSSHSMRRAARGRRCFLYYFSVFMKSFQRTLLFVRPQGFSLKADAKVGTFRATAKYFRGFFRKITKVFCYFYKIRFIVGKKHGFVAKNRVGTIAKHLIHHLAIVTN